MFNPTLIAARWYFGEFMHEDLPSIAMDALENDYDGPKLRRLAGLIRPLSSNVSSQEVDEAFREMGIAAALSMQEAQLILATETARAAVSGMQNPFDAATHIRIYICGRKEIPQEVSAIVRLSKLAKHSPRFTWARLEKQIRVALADFLATRQ